MSRLLSEDRKVRILDAARKTIAARGFLGTRAQDVAETAQVSEALLFRYFPSMRALQEAVVATGKGSKPVPWPRHLSEMSPPAALRAAASAFLSVFVRDPALLRLTLFGALFGDMDSVEPYCREVRRTTRRIELLIRGWKQSGWARKSVDPYGVACLFVSALVHAVMTSDVFGLPRKKTSLETDIGALIELLKGTEAAGGQERLPIRPVRFHPLRDKRRRKQ